MRDEVAAWTRAWRKARLRRWAALRAPPAVCPGLVVLLVPRLCDSVPASSAGAHHRFDPHALQPRAQLMEEATSAGSHSAGKANNTQHRGKKMYVRRLR